MICLMLNLHNCNAMNAAPRAPERIGNKLYKPEAMFGWSIKTEIIPEANAFSKQAESLVLVGNRL
jgi:hypothetical protein